MINLPEHKKLILFDGVCNLCNGSVQYIIKRDKNDIFRFAPLQSNIGQEIINQYHIDTSKTDSILLYSKQDGLLFKSSAVLKILKVLGFPYNLSAIFYMIPNAVRNWAYDFVARNRYKWYGKQEACMIPTPELKSKFLV